MAQADVRFETVQTAGEADIEAVDAGLHLYDPRRLAGRAASPPSCCAASSAPRANAAAQGSIGALRIFVTRANRPALASFTPRHSEPSHFVIPSRRRGIRHRRCHSEPKARNLLHSRRRDPSHSLAMTAPAATPRSLAFARDDAARGHSEPSPFRIPGSPPSSFRAEGEESPSPATPKSLALLAMAGEGETSVRRGDATRFNDPQCLGTFGFQAPALYERDGDEVAFRIDGFPDGIVEYVMQRSLDRTEVQR